MTLHSPSPYKNCTLCTLSSFDPKVDNIPHQLLERPKQRQKTETVRSRISKKEPSNYAQKECNESFKSRNDWSRKKSKSSLRQHNSNSNKAIIYWVVVRMLNSLGIRWWRGNMLVSAPWASLCPAWPWCPPGTCPRSPGLPARAPPPPGWGWSPSRSGGWHKLAPAALPWPAVSADWPGPGASAWWVISSSRHSAQTGSESTESDTRHLLGTGLIIISSKHSKSLLWTVFVQAV